MACMFILKLSEFIKKHSVLADPGHYPTLEKLVHFGIEYVKCSLHPDWFFYNFLEDCASANPSLFSDTDALENALLIAGKCIARGIAPLKDADRDREFYGLLDGYYSYRGGRFTELNSQTNRALLFSAMSTYEERLEYAYFMGKPVNIPRGNGWEMPGALLLVNGREIREISETVGDTAGLVNEVRAILLALADNPSVMAGEAGLLSCLGRKERRFLVDKANFPNDDPAPVIERLWLRQARNYQPELARYFEKLLILKALKDNPGLRDVIRNGAANTAAAAIRDLLENTLLAVLESSLHRTSVEYLTGMIEKETGLPLKNDAFRHMGLKEMSRTIRDEVRACTRLIDLHRVMPQFCSLAAGGSGPGRSLVPVGFSLNRKNEPLLLLDGVYKEYMRCYLRVEDEKGIKKIKQLKILPGAAFSLLGGRYESDIDLLNTDPEMEKLIYYDGEGLPACKYAMNLAEDEIRAIGRTVRVLTRRVLPLFSTLSTFGRAMLGRINRAMLSRWHTSQNPDELVLVPGKDQGLVLRYLPGLDCSSGINAQLAHPSSFFYRVVRGGKWIGYFLLLELRGVDGDRALLIDVINSGDHAAIDWAGVTERFTGYLAKAGRWGRVLLSTNSDIISNQDYIRDPVYARFRNHPRVPGDRYYLDPPDTSFHAPAFDYFDITGEG